MNISTILFILVIIVLLYIIIRYMTSDASTLAGLTSGTTMTTISASSLATSSSGANSSNFTYSIWFYVNDWNYRYGEPKVIYGRMAGTTSGSGGTVSGVQGNGPCPLVSFGPISNNIDIALSVYPGITSEEGTATSTTTNSIIHNCPLQNVPIQKWVNLLISVYGRTLDVYLDGKLVKTCVLPGIAKINNDANVYVTPNGGFSGWTSKFQYYANATDPQTAWNIYKSGYGGGPGLGTYQVKVALVNNGTETKSITV
jgi:hypothetical protein